MHFKYFLLCKVISYLERKSYLREFISKYLRLVINKFLAFLSFILISNKLHIFNIETFLFVFFAQHLINFFVCFTSIWKAFVVIIVGSSFLCVALGHVRSSCYSNILYSYWCCLPFLFWKNYATVSTMIVDSLISFFNSFHFLLSCLV